MTAVFPPPTSPPDLLANAYPRTTAYGVPSALTLYVGFIRSRQDRKVPAEYVTPCGFPLGWWVGQQIERRERGELPRLAVRRLEATGFVWSQDPLK
ncbi:MAG: helicase associated domain-containing protein, partial [Candidatus Nanopelagicales bacterium]